MSEPDETHRMGKRCQKKNYRLPGAYHITINVAERQWHPLGQVVGNLDQPDGDANAPRVELTAIGKMVEEELTKSITTHYPMIEVQDYVVMPEHLHFILVVHNSIISRNGRETHLGQVIAGFKKGCNRRYWEMTGMTANEQEDRTANGQSSLLRHHQPPTPLRLRLCRCDAAATRPTRNPTPLHPQQPTQPPHAHQ